MQSWRHLYYFLLKLFLPCRIQEQRKFPPFTKNHAILFLHACYWELEATKSALTQYVSIRANSPELFDNRDPSLKNIQLILNVA